MAGMDMSMVLPRAVKLLESDRCGTILSDLLWDAHKYPSYLISIEIKTLYLRSLQQCFSTVFHLQNRRTRLLHPFANNRYSILDSQKTSIW